MAKKVLRIFVTGSGTGIGKTVVSSIIAEALEADYWKPVQAGSLEDTDSMKVKRWMSNRKSVVHSEGYLLSHPVSPHEAARRDGVRIVPEEIRIPDTRASLVIEGAGGLMSPVNDTLLVIDLIELLNADAVVIVSGTYLGSISHTLLTVNAVMQRGLNAWGIFFTGGRNVETENFILSYSGLSCIGVMDEEAIIDQIVIKKYAEKFKQRNIA